MLRANYSSVLRSDLRGPGNGGERRSGANTPPEKRKYMRKSQLWSQEFTAKLFGNIEFWLERLPQLIEPEPELERPVAAGRSLLPRGRPRG